MKSCPGAQDANPKYRGGSTGAGKRKEGLMLRHGSRSMRRDCANLGNENLSTQCQATTVLRTSVVVLPDSNKNAVVRTVKFQSFNATSPTLIHKHSVKEMTPGCALVF